MKQDFRFDWKLFDAVPQYILMFDCNGNIKMANIPFLEVVDVGKNEISDMTLDDLEPYYSIQGGKEQFPKVKKQGSLTAIRSWLIQRGMLFLWSKLWCILKMKVWIIF